MKKILKLSLSLMLSCVSLITPQRSIASADQVRILARVSRNLGPVDAIELVSVHPADALGGVNDQLLVQSITANGAEHLNVTRYRTMLNHLLALLYNAKSVTKSRKNVCYMIPHPTPELAVARYSEKTQTVTMDTILTNQSCAFENWIAPESPTAEMAAEVLYRFILDSAIR